MASTTVVDELLSVPLERLLRGDGGGQQDEERSLASRGESLYSRFTNCTNATFDSVHREWKSGSKLQTDVAAVLAGVTEVIESGGGQQSNAEYFGALLSAFESCPPENDGQLAATAFLLDLVVRRIRPPLLRRFFSRVSQVIYPVLARGALGQSEAVLRHLVACFVRVLAAQSRGVWQVASNRQMLMSLCSLSLSDIAKVRKDARKGIERCLAVTAVQTEQGLSAKPQLHPCAVDIGRFFLEELERARATGDAATVCRALNCYELTLHQMPADLWTLVAESVCELLGDLRAVPHVKQSAMRALCASLRRQPGGTTLSADTNAQLVGALGDVQPPVGDSHSYRAWVDVFVEAHVCLHAKDAERCAGFLLPSIGRLLSSTSSGGVGDAVVSSLTAGLGRLIEHCLAAPADAHADWADQRLCDVLLGRLATAVNCELPPPFVVSSMQYFFEKLASACGRLANFGVALTMLADLREAADEHETAGAFEYTIGCAVRHVGIEAVLTALPIRLDVDSLAAPLDFPRAWLLPVLRSAMGGGPLAHFAAHFLPAAMALKRRAGELRGTAARLYTCMQLQLWDLLPGYCRKPTDLCSSFAGLAQLLGTVLMERGDLRLIVLKALRRLIRFSQQVEGEAERDEMGKYAKNFMPILFNLYTAETPTTELPGYDVKGVHLAVLETIRAYVQLTPTALLDDYVSVALQKAADESVTVDCRVAVMDVVVALAHDAAPHSLTRILDTIAPWLESELTDGRLQKKAYRLLEEAAKTRLHDDDERVRAAVTSLLERARAASVAIAPPVKAARTAALYVLPAAVTMPDNANLDALDKSWQEIIGGLARSNSKKVRHLTRAAVRKRTAEVVESWPGGATAALDLLLTRLWALGVGDVNGSPESLDDAALRGVLLAVHLVIQENVRAISGATLCQTISNCCGLLKFGKTAYSAENLRLFRTILTSLPQPIVMQYKDILMQNFAQYARYSGKRDQRLHVRQVVKAFVKMFGSATISQFGKNWRKTMRQFKTDFVAEHGVTASPLSKKQKQRQLQAEIRERLHRKEAKKRQQPKVGAAPSIADMLHDDDSDSEAKSARPAHKAMSIRENAETRVVDLLQPREVLASLRSAPRRAVAANRVFATAPDGRLIIADGAEEGERAAVKRRLAPDVQVAGDDDPPLKQTRVDKADEADGGGGGGPTTVARRSLLNKARLTGDQFRAKRAGGDVQPTSQQFQPFAYLPIAAGKKNRSKFAASLKLTGKKSHKKRKKA